MTMTATCTNEQLVSMIQSGEDATSAYEQLFINLRPVILSEARMYQGKMTTYDREDLIQEGHIIIWKTTGTFKSGNFRTYFTTAVKRHFINLYRDYTLKNMVCIAETDDFGGYGYTTQTLVESDYAKAYREKHRQCKAWYEKKKASQPPKEPKPKKAPETKEERSKRIMAYQKEYYAAHPDKLAERREKNRIRERERRAAKKAAATAAATA